MRGGRGACWPGDAAGVEQDAEPVVLEGAEAVAAALDLLHAEVEALGGAVAGAGDVVGEDLGPPGRRGSCRASGSRRTSSARQPAMALSSRSGRRPECRRGTTSRTDSLASQAPRTSSWGSPTRRPSSIRSRPRSSRRSVPVSNSLRIRIQRVVLAAPMAEGLVLDPAADLVEAAVGDPHDMERVGDPAGVVEVRGQPGPERLGQVGGHHLDPRQPARVGVGGPSPQVGGRVALDHVDHDVPLEVDQAGGVDGRVVRGWRPGTRSRRCPAGAPGRPGRGHRPAGCRARSRRSSSSTSTPRTPRPPATPAGRAHRPAGRPPPRPGGSTPPGRRAARSVSVQVLASHIAVGAAPRRLTHTSRAGRPKQGRSRRCDRHPILRLGPHPAAPATHEVRRRLDRDDQLLGRLDHLEHPEAVQSQQRLGQADTVVTQGSPRRRSRSNSRDDGGTPAPRVDPQLNPLPTSARRAS